MARFDDYFIDELTSRADIVDVVSRYAQLTRKGDRLWALCPFHGEKTPSFTVSPEKQLYYCFGCGKGGGVINFIMEIERLDFSEAVEFLAGMFNMELPDRATEKAANYRKRLLEINREAALFYHKNLSLPEGRRAVEYIKKRALLPATVARFGIGAAPDGWDGLCKYLKSRGYSQNEIIEAGLARRGKNGGIYDVFRDRLMFPIIDAKNNVLAFGGRVLEGDGGGQKYLNTGNTPIYSKKDNLFAYNIAKKSKSDKIILVEGYMDAVSLHQAGFDYTVASLGTALTPEQARLMAKTAKEVIIAYDTDKAGTAATERAVSMLTDSGLTVKILRVPGKKDPDEFIRQYGAEEFARVLEKSEEQMDYRLAALKKGLDLTNDEDRIKYIKASAELLSSLRNRIALEVYAGRVAEETGVNRDTVIAEAERIKKAESRAEMKKQHRADINPDRLIQPPRDSGVRYENPAAARAEESLISLITRYPEMAKKIKNRISDKDFTSKNLGGIFSVILKKIEAGVQLNPNILANELSDEDMRLYSKVISSNRPHVQPERELEDLCELILSGRNDGAGEDPLLKIREIKRKRGTEDIDG
jgi:DNA primase